MTGAITVHASATIRPLETRLVEWWADAPEGARHAFPVGDGFPQRAWCGARWTVRFGHAGGFTCGDCEAVLKSAIRDLARHRDVAPEAEAELREAWGK